MGVWGRCGYIDQVQKRKNKPTGFKVLTTAFPHKLSYI